MPTPHTPSISVERVLKKLGHDIRIARLRRRLPATVVAARAMTSRPTLARVENGDPGVGMGIYAAVLSALGFQHRLRDLADPGADEMGMTLAIEDLPKRPRTVRRTP